MYDQNTNLAKISICYFWTSLQNIYNGSAFGYSYFCVGFSPERKSERIERKFKKQNPNPKASLRLSFVPLPPMNKSRDTALILWIIWKTTIFVMAFFTFWHLPTNLPSAISKSKALAKISSYLRVCIKDTSKTTKVISSNYSCIKVTKTCIQISHENWKGFFSNIRGWFN